MKYWSKHKLVVWDSSPPSKTAAVVLARGGSKRIPRKNIKDFCGKPMIAYPLDAAISCPDIDQVFVSSDDKEILELAESSGAIPIVRPKALALDETPTIPAVRHAISEIVEREEGLTEVCCLYGANPFVTAAELSRAYDHLMAKKNKFVFSAVKFSYPIERGFMLGSKNQVTMRDPAAYKLRTQDCRPLYHDADLYYWGFKDSWLNEDQIFCQGSAAIIYPRNSSFPIDNVEDWTLAESILQSRATVIAT